MTLTEFLLARIAEDEDGAQYVDEAAAEYGGDDVEWHWIRYYRRAPRSPHSSAIFEGAWDPARVLAECEAKRRIVNLEMPSHYVGAECDGWWEAHDLVLCYLALPDADHADYDEAWRP